MKWLILCIFLSLNIEGKDSLVYLGAGGEDPKSDTTIFDEGTKLFTKFYAKVKNKYETTVAFNGGHKKTEKIVKSGFAGATIKKSFDKKTFEKIIADLKVKMTSEPPEIKSGEKLMLFIDTHGSEKAKEQSTHNISLSGAKIEGFNSGSADDDSMNLDSLKELAELAKEKNIKLAIVDGSCHSGNSLQLANESTCVISGSLPNQYATDLTNHLAFNMRSGVSLEKAFLAARSTADGTPFPMISSPAGLKVQEDLKGIVPFLFYHEKVDETFSLDKIDTYLVESANEENDCKRNLEFKELFQMLNFIKDYNKAMNKRSKINFQSLIKKIKAFKKVQDQYIANLRKTNVNSKFFNELVEVSVSGLRYEFSRKDLLETDYDQLIKDKKLDMAKLTSDEEKSKEQKKIDFFIEAKKVKESIAKNPDVIAYNKILSDIQKDEKFVPKTFEDIGKEMRRVYLDHYKNVSEEMKSVKNPCAEFII